MPRDLRPLFAEETTKPQTAQLFHLVEIQYPEGVLYHVGSNYSVTFNGQVYASFPLQMSGISTSSDGSVDQATLVIANVSREIMYFVERYNGLRNMRVKVKTAYENALDFIYTPEIDGTVTATANPSADPEAYIEDEFIIDGYSANEKTITFMLYPLIDLDVKLPRRRFMVDSCYWLYKDPFTCQYSGSLPTCKKDLADCKAHNNEVRFGGFPGVNGGRRLFI